MEWSQVINNHGRLQYEVGALIDKNKGSGKIIMECSIETSDGVKVADVAWASDEFLKSYAYDTPYIKAPEIRTIGVRTIGVRVKYISLNSTLPPII